MNIVGLGNLLATNEAEVASTATLHVVATETLILCDSNVAPWTGLQTIDKLTRIICRGTAPPRMVEFTLSTPLIVAPWAHHKALVDAIKYETTTSGALGTLTVGNQSCTFMGTQP
jgi:hypothetical protein